MYFKAANVVGMRFKFLDFLHGIVIKGSHTHVVAGGNEPLFAGDKLGAADGQLGYLKGFLEGSRFVVPNHDITGIQGGQDPWFRGVEVDRLDAFRSRREFLLNVEAEGLGSIEKGRSERNDLRELILVLTLATS